MKRKQLAKRVAIAMLSAATVMTATPVGAFAATSVVSVDASDAYVSNTASIDGFKDELNKQLASATIGDISSASDSSEIATALTTAVTTLTVNGTQYTLSNFEITAHTAPSYTTTAAGGKVVMPVLTIKADVNQSTTSKGTVTFTVDATELTRSEQLDAAIAVLQGAGGKTLTDPAMAAGAASTYNNDDNKGSLEGYVNAILGSANTAITNIGEITASTSTAESAGVKLTVSQGDVTPATKTAAGSETVNITLKTVLDGSVAADKADPAYDATKADKDGKVTIEKTASYTADLAKLPVTGKDDSYQAKIEAALKSVKLMDTDLGTAKSGDKLTSSTTAGAGKGAYDAIKTALDKVGLKEDNMEFTLRHLTKASHKEDGSVEVLFDQARVGETKEEYATVTLPIVHAGDTVEIEKEVAAKVNATESALVADSKDVSSSSGTKAGQLKDLKANIQKKVEEALQDKLEGSNTIASEIDKVEVSLVDNKYTAATASTQGTIAADGLLIKVTYKDDLAAAPTRGADSKYTVDWVNTDAKTVTYKNTDAISIYHLDSIAAMNLSLNDEYVMSYDVADPSKSKVEITPSFTPSTSNTYKIRWTLSGDNKAKFEVAGIDGTALANPDKTLQNQGVKVTVASGKTVVPGDEVTLTADLIDSDSLVAATATTTVKVVKGFSDVQNSHDYAYNAINYLSQERTVYKDKKWIKTAVIYGVGNNSFDPEGDVTRAQFVTFLYRLAQQDGNGLTKTADGVNDKYDGTNTTVTKSYTDAAGNTVDFNYPVFNDSKASNKFTDVDANAYYAKAVDWAVANGIANGKTDTTFDPNGKVTRAEAATFLYRYYANGQNYNAADFSDVPTTAYYANAVGWASSNGVTQGKTATTFAPNDTTTRKEAAAFIYRATNTAKINK